MKDRRCFRQPSNPSFRKRGDVVLFHPRGDHGVTFVMRVIGLPGDRVQMRQGHLHLNGAPLRREFLERADLGGERFLVFRERMPEGQSYRVIEQDTPLPGDNNRSNLNEPLVMERLEHVANFGMLHFPASGTHGS